MAKLLKLRRGTTTQHGSFTGAEGEVTVDTDKETLVVHDGSTAGGHPVAAEDMANVSSASIAGRLANDSIATTKIAAGALPTDVTVTNANVVSNAAIAGTKISPSFGSQNIATSGHVDLEDSSVVKLGTDDDFQLSYDNGNNQALISMATGKRLKLKCDSIHINNAADNSNILLADDTGAVSLFHGTSEKFKTQSGGISVTGDITASGDITTNGGDLTVSGTTAILHLTDTNNDDDFSLMNENGNFRIRDATNGLNRLNIDSSGNVGIPGNLDASGGVDVTGNITVTGTVDGVDVAQLNTNAGSFFANGSGLLVNGVTATTQSAGDASTKVATTAYTDTAISNLVNSAPSTLDTLGEIATALNNDAALNTTLTTSIATKLPKTGGVMSGDISLGNNNRIKMGSDHGLQVYRDSNVSHIAESGTGPLRISTDEFQLMNVAQNSTMIYAPQTGGVSINYSGNTKIQTTNTGATITGTCTATAFAGDGSALTGIVSFVSGMILLWSGSTGNIPSGWVLCDGNAGTPNLQDRFVIGAGNSYSVGTTGGSTTDTVNITVSGTTGSPSGSGNGGYPPQYQMALWNHTHSFSGSGSDTVSTMSPYYALCYIMKT
jgi:hypothetical protein